MNNHWDVHPCGFSQPGALERGNHHELETPYGTLEGPCHCDPSPFSFDEKAQLLLWKILQGETGNDTGLSNDATQAPDASTTFQSVAEPETSTKKRKRDGQPPSKSQEEMRRKVAESGKLLAELCDVPYYQINRKEGKLCCNTNKTASLLLKFFEYMRDKKEEFMPLLLASAPFTQQ